MSTETARRGRGQGLAARAVEGAGHGVRRSIRFWEMSLRDLGRANFQRTFIPGRETLAQTRKLSAHPMLEPIGLDVLGQGVKVGAGQDGEQVGEGVGLEISPLDQCWIPYRRDAATPCTRGRKVRGLGQG